MAERTLLDPIVSVNPEMQGACLGARFPHRLSALMRTTWMLVPLGLAAGIALLLGGLVLAWWAHQEGALSVSVALNEARMCRAEADGPEVKVTNGRAKGQGHDGREDDLAPLVAEEDNESGDFEAAQPSQNGWAGVEGMEPPAFMVRFYQKNFCLFYFYFISLIFKILFV